MTLDLPLSWAGLIAVAVLLYVCWTASIWASASCFRSRGHRRTGT